MIQIDNWFNRSKDDGRAVQEGGQQRFVEQQQLNDSAETNLFNALLALKPKLVEMGFIGVVAETVATSKSAILEEDFVISIKGAINSPDSVGLVFNRANGNDVTIHLECWNDMSTRLTECASREQFIERIKKELGIVDQVVLDNASEESSAQNLNWENWGEPVEVPITRQSLFTEEQLLSQHPELGIRPNYDIILSRQQVQYDIYIKSNDNLVVVSIKVTSPIGSADKPIPQAEVAAFKKQLSTAIVAANKSRTRQNISFDNSGMGQPE